MAKKKKRAGSPTGKPISAFLTYISARGFLASAQILDREPNSKMHLCPAIMCAIFSLELHLKCLYRIRRRYGKGGHNVQLLFQGLSERDKREITKRFDLAVTTHPLYESYVEIGTKMDIESVLTRLSDVFDRIRYWNEEVQSKPDSDDFSGSPGIDTLSNVLNQIILEIHPEWPERGEKGELRFLPDRLRQPTSQSHQMPEWPSEFVLAPHWPSNQ
jgi:hypothetical protein